MTHPSTSRRRQLWIRLAVLTGGLLPLLGDCDPQIQQTVEDGVINVSTGVLGAFFQAIINLATEASQQTAMATDALSVIVA